MVGALYASSIQLSPDNVEPVYRAADAMQVMSCRALDRCAALPLGCVEC